MLRMTDPTPQDIRNAAARQAIADRQSEAYHEAGRLALATLGPGWTPWMKLALIDSDHHRTGNVEPAVVAYKVYQGQKRVTENSVFLRRMPDGSVKKAASFELLFGDMLNQLHLTRKLELLHGQVVPAPRWTLCWSALELYNPRSAEELSKARVLTSARK
jgi:hypothetical protein